MVNGPADFRQIRGLLPVCALVLPLAAMTRGAEDDEQYTLFLTAGTPRPAWPEAPFPAGLARTLQTGRTDLITIGRDLRRTDVHPPLYFWLVSLWRRLFGPGLLTARLLSAGLGVGCLALTGIAAALARVPPGWAMGLTLGCYGFSYTASVARGFALADCLLLGGAVCLLAPRRAWRYGLAGGLFGAAVLTNYLALFVAAAALGVAGLAAIRDRVFRPVLCAAVGFLAFIPADLWWFLAQRGSRDGQFPPFAAVPALLRLLVRAGGAVFGGLPLYAGGGLTASALGLLALWIGWDVIRRGARPLFLVCAAATPIGLLVLGFVFGNTPIEVRYLTFSLPFLGLLLAGSLGWWTRRVLALVQMAAIGGLLLAPGTMQPAGGAAAAVARLGAADAVVMLPRGNDGVGIPGAFAIESPPDRPLMLVLGGDTPATLIARMAGRRRIIAVSIEQDEASRAATGVMRRFLSTPAWREVARDGLAALYERRDDGG